MFQLDKKTLDLIKKTCKGKKHIKLTVGFIIDGEIVIKVFNEDGETDSEGYTYEIGSITKTFTASLLSKYVFENKMQLNDSIQKYIAELDGNQYYPSLRRIATHTAGYPERYPLNQWEFINLFKDMIIGGNIQRVNPLDMDFNKMLALIQKSILKDMDYKWKYSNFGMALLGYAIGTVTGKGYWDAMNDFLVNELGLRHTYLGTSGNDLSGFSTKNEHCGNWNWDKINLISPAGAISSTAEDMLTYAKLNMYEEKPYLSLCHQKHTKGAKKYDMGLAWWLREENNNIMSHGGGTGCFSSFLAMDKQKKVASVILANYRLGINSDEKIGFSILEGLQKDK